VERNSHDLGPFEHDPRVVGRRVIRWPTLGQEWEGLLLLDELGRGAFSRVYLAEELAAGRRLVAVKLTPHATREPRLQGRLSHEFVAPIFSTRWSTDRRFQIAIMPYRGRATLCDVIRYARGLRARDDSSEFSSSSQGSDSSDGVLEVVAGTVEWIDGDGAVAALEGESGEGAADRADDEASLEAMALDRSQRLEIHGVLRQMELLLAAEPLADLDSEVDSENALTSDSESELDHASDAHSDGACDSSVEETLRPSSDSGIRAGVAELSGLLEGLALCQDGEFADDEIPLETLVIDVLRVGIEIAGALEHAHALGVYHCDLKPSNVLVDAVGRILLIDFNLAIERADLSGPLGGTLPYMPPERLAPFGWRERAGEFRERISPAGSDLFSLAALMYELLTGEPPYGGGDQTRTLADQAMSILCRQLEGIHDSTTPDEKKLTRPERLVIELLDECLDCRSGRRMSDLGEFVRRAEAILVMAERRPGLPQRANWLAKVPRRVGWLLLVAAMLAVALVGERWFLYSKSYSLVSETRVDFALSLKATVGKVRRDFVPSDHESWVLVGDGHLYRGETLAAIGVYNQARRMGCENPAVFNNSGLANARLGRYAAAERDFGEAIRRDGQLVEAYVNRARSNYEWFCRLNADAKLGETRELMNRLVFQIRRDELRVRELGGEPPLPKSWEPVKLARLSPSQADG
jgi:hypothetical protein